MNTRSAVQSVADVVAGLILATADISASPERVFRALTASDEVVRWWGSDDVYRTTAWVADLRVNGHWRADGRQTDGTAFSVEGEFLAIDAPRKIAQTWKADWDEGKPTTLTYRLEATEGGTRVTLRHEGFQGRADSCRSYAEGWRLVLQWLERHFAPEPAVASSRFFLFRLNPPRPAFPKDATAQELAVMQEHFAHWTKLSQAGTAIVYGPVDDPKGTWGVAIVRVADEGAARALAAGDPAIRSGLGFRYDVSAMPQALLGA
ncbi:SRPBCC domain-containing protein [Afipia sp. GAS231]|uniref:SRPBCC domain-containing protein n=1 Tax=Afipia sp. GAS231 TaxID=1882747 RepID=UPI00087B9053|nr:SRPBCC domain-containing protein [Afipia sp. GAS231]SDN77391.1 Uncharacterized conserved protein YndB, AHSA1/START domain [Afipia sp. GAS231]